MGKIALVVGHNPTAQGAVRASDGRTEYDWNGALAAAVMVQQPGMYRIFRRTPGAGEIGRCYEAVNAWGADAAVELHFNGAAASTATGTETLTSGTRNSLRFAGLMQAAMVGALGLRNRGLITLPTRNSGRGATSLWSARAPAILIEPYFGSNKADCAAADRHYSALVRAIHGACVAYLKE